MAKKKKKTNPFSYLTSKKTKTDALDEAGNLGPKKKKRKKKEDKKKSKNLPAGRVTKGGVLKKGFDALNKAKFE